MGATDNRDFQSLKPVLRSLLQKAVRRGYAELAQKVAYKLASNGDSAWLHTRAAVIVFEECWPCANLLEDNTITSLKKVAIAVKNKNAAGLGSLAHAFSEGDPLAVDYSLHNLPIKIIAAALRRPEDFFKWASNACRNSEQSIVVRAAHRYFSQASWPWDKAFMAAGAYLACQNNVPPVNNSTSENRGAFPYWTAVDKHTPQGKAALKKTAYVLRLPEQALQWASFYFESARTQALEPSPWWQCEIKWRFEKIGLDLKEAKEMWNLASPYVESAVQPQTQIITNVLKDFDTDFLLK